MATVNLGSIKFKWKGTYSGATAYTIDDVVEYNGSSYICVSNSTGNLPTNATYFEQMSSAGTNGTDGTDLGTTLTTQGDIVYRDGSGLQRLPIGTANQILQVNSGATALEYTAKPEGGLVHLNTTDVSSAGGYVSFPNIFTTDYDYYRCHFSNFRNTSSGYALIAYLTDNVGSQLGSGQYETVGISGFGTSSADGVTTNRRWGINYIDLSTINSLYNTVPASGYIDISNPRDSGDRVTYTGQMFYHDGSYHRVNSFGGCLANSVEVYGIEFSVSGGSINTKSVFSVFGYKKS